MVLAVPVGGFLWIACFKKTCVCVFFFYGLFYWFVVFIGMVLVCHSFLQVALYGFSSAFS